MLESKASFSEDRRYRFTLYRRWAEDGHEILFIGLNPSTADEAQNDATVRRCINFAKSWGYAGIWLGNLFAFRSTDVRELYTHRIYEVYDPVGRGNDLALQGMAERCAKVVYAWGNHGRLLSRGREVHLMLGRAWCFGINKTGQPTHPLYQPNNARLVPFPQEESK